MVFNRPCNVYPTTKVAIKLDILQTDIFSWRTDEIHHVVNSNFVFYEYKMYSLLYQAINKKHPVLAI